MLTPSSFARAGRFGLWHRLVAGSRHAGSLGDLGPLEPGGPRACAARPDHSEYRDEWMIPLVTPGSVLDLGIGGQSWVTHLPVYVIHRPSNELSALPSFLFTRLDSLTARGPPRTLPMPHTVCYTFDSMNESPGEAAEATNASSKEEQLTSCLALWMSKPDGNGTI